VSAWPPRPEGHTPDKTGNPDEPWLTRDAITYLNGNVDTSMSVLEFGAGSSTAWFAGRVGRVYSVEHDHGWWDLTTQRVLEGKFSNVSLYHVPDTNDFEDYIQFGRKLAAHYKFDVIVVDGRRRVRCIKAVAEFLAKDGMIVLDNAERPCYAEIHEFMKDWFVKRTNNGIWRTDIFRR